LSSARERGERPMTAREKNQRGLIADSGKKHLNALDEHASIRERMTREQQRRMMYILQIEKSGRDIMSEAEFRAVHVRGKGEGSFHNASLKKRSVMTTRENHKTGRT